LIGGKGKGAVTAYVMTKEKFEDRILMYQGVLKEFYLSGDGHLSYVVLTDCSRYYMRLEEDNPRTTHRIDIFREGQMQRKWNYLAIDGTCIANIVFDKSPEIRRTPGGDEALKKALREALKEALQEFQDSR
jgi:hypothetical protein